MCVIGHERTMEGRTNRNQPNGVLNIERSIDHYRGGGVCMDVDGDDDDCIARDEIVDAETEGTVRFGGLGELFAPEDLTSTKERKIRKWHPKIMSR